MTNTDNVIQFRAATEPKHLPQDGPITISRLLALPMGEALTFLEETHHTAGMVYRSSVLAGVWFLSLGNAYVEMPSSIAEFTSPYEVLEALGFLKEMDWTPYQERTAQRA